jgi:hypothetical protein
MSDDAVRTGALDLAARFGFSVWRSTRGVDIHTGFDGGTVVLCILGVIFDPWRRYPHQVGSGDGGGGVRKGARDPAT